MRIGIKSRRKLNEMLRHTVAATRVRLSRVHDWSHHEEGAVLVEIAFSIVILLSVVFGIMAISLALYSYFFVSEAAREATRYAIVRGNSNSRPDCTSPGYATCIAQPTDIQSYVRDLAFPGVTASNITATSTWWTSTGGACGTTDSCKIPGNRVQVTVSYPYPLSIPFGPQRTLTLASTSNMVVAH
jgi:Flp pilus assembly protein TadG